MSIKKLGFAAVLAMGSMAANAQALPAANGGVLPVLNQLGGPLLSTTLGNLAGPIVGGLVPVLIPIASAGLGGLLGAPLNMVGDLSLNPQGGGGSFALPGLE